VKDEQRKDAETQGRKEEQEGFPPLRPGAFALSEFFVEEAVFL